MAQIKIKMNRCEKKHEKRSALFENLLSPVVKQKLGTKNTPGQWGTTGDNGGPRPGTKNRAHTKPITEPTSPGPLQASLVWGIKIKLD